MSRSYGLAASAFGFWALVTSAAEADPLNLFSTNPLSQPSGLANSDWTLFSFPSGTGSLYDVTGTTLFPGAWTAGTNWISPNAGLDSPVGSYDYRATFSLSGLDPSSAVITGSWASDDEGMMLVNNNFINSNAIGSSYQSLTAFTIPVGDLVAGINTIDFLIGNDPCSGCTSGNPAGLLVNITEASAIPEPASLALLGSALLGFGVIRRRRAAVGAEQPPLVV